MVARETLLFEDCRGGPHYDGQWANPMRTDPMEAHAMIYNQ
jgi:hypothetical protein